MFIVNSIAEREQYLDQIDWGYKRECALSLVYLLVEYNDQIEPLCFAWIENRWIGFKCRLIRTKPVDERFMVYIRKVYDEKEVNKIFKFLENITRNGYMFRIKSFSNVAQLPDKVIFHQVMSESDCINWFLEKYPDAHKKVNGC